MPSQRGELALFPARQEPADYGVLRNVEQDATRHVKAWEITRAPLPEQQGAPFPA